MADKSLLDQIKLDESLRPICEKIVAFLEDKSGCGARVYKLPSARELRAAQVAPGENGRKRADQVFVRIRPKKDSIVLRRRKRYREGKPKEQGEIEIGPAFNDWEEMEKQLREWSYDPKTSKKPKAEYESGTA